jgi:hypothetical protein
MQQLYAKIKKNSKYYGQNQLAKREGNFPFPVTITNINDPDCYFVQGGPGGQYRLDDVNLFVVDSEKEIRIR